MERLTHLPTLRISPDKPLPFTYMGKRYQGMAGDTVATALYANGVRIFGRSLKYHRPRGLYSLDGESSNTYMQVNEIPNVRIETALLQEGMTVKPQNVLGSPEFDLMGFLDWCSWAMPAGFYYRCMHKPYVLWPFFRKWVRKLAGLGKMPPSFVMQGKYDEIYPQTDVCVIGGGPAGMTAALAAAEQGLRVILMEARPWLGGSFDYRISARSLGKPLYQRASELAKQVETIPHMRVLTHTSVIGAYNNNLITAFQVGGQNHAFDERYIEIRAKSIIVATGCIERPLIFENNERPGVMQVHCAHRLAHTYGILPGKEAVFSVGHDLGLEVALDLSELGVLVSAVADCREEGHDPRLVEVLTQKRIRFLPGWVASKAHGGRSVKRVTLSSINGTRKQDFACDLLVASAGLTPVTGPLSLAQAKMSFDPHTTFFLPIDYPPSIHAAGRLLGFDSPESVEASGRLAGISAAVDCGAASKDVKREAEEQLSELPGPAKGTHLVAASVSGRKSFVCFDEDTTLRHIDQAHDMGFENVELSKRFTAAGTGPGQGGIPGHNLPLIISRCLTHSSASPMHPSTVRAPLVPTFLATYAGSNHDMYKRTPVHESQEALGAIFRRIGNWKRARYFSKDLTCREEIENVRKNVGIIEVATLGKFRIYGPDALKALQRVYVGDMSKIAEGKVKYSAMCNDDACLIDDGVIVKRGKNDYYFTTSTARAGETVEWFRYHTRYEGWDFHMVRLTDALGAINLAGPDSRKVLQRITDADVSNKTLPFMGYRELTISGGISSRVMRLGFVGELSYEIHMPASYMQTVWDLLLEAGKEWGIRPFGLEAQNCLRLEKAHVIIGQESEIRTTLHDLGLGFLWHREKEDSKTVGAVALRQTEHQKGRLKLVGFKMDTPDRCPQDGSVIVNGGAIRGHVCTARYSFTLGESIGLALVEDHLAELGTQVEIFEPGKGDHRTYGKVVSTPFYDPEGERLRM